MESVKSKILPNATKEQGQFVFGTIRKFMCVTGRGPGLQPCVYERVNGSAMAVSGGECAATVCVSEEEGFQQSVCEYLFVCGCACVEQ